MAGQTSREEIFEYINRLSSATNVQDLVAKLTPILNCLASDYVIGDGAVSDALNKWKRESNKALRREDFLNEDGYVQKITPISQYYNTRR